MSSGGGSTNGKGHNGAHLRDLILSLDRPKARPLKGVKIKGEQVYMRSLTGSERDELESASQGEGGRIGWRGRVAAMTLCDVDGVRLFSIQDAGLLNGLDSELLDIIVFESGNHNRFSADAIEDAEKNSAASPSESSTSASPSA